LIIYIQSINIEKEIDDDLIDKMTGVKSE